MNAVPSLPDLHAMKPTIACLILLPACWAAAQNPASPAKAAPRTAIAGIVTKSPGSQPVKKAVIELIAENQAEGGDYTAVTAPDGTFRIEGIVPGRYHLFAERTGLLQPAKNGGDSTGRVLTLAAGQELTDLQIRLQAAAIVRGRITDEDGDPLANADVAVLRETFVTGRRRWEQAGAERTNDLGEYRVAALPAGNYYVSVTPPPDFKSMIEATGAAAAGADHSPSTSYQTTYYPGTMDRSQAQAIQLRAGDEFPIDLSLAPSPTLSIRGSVMNLPPRSSAVIMLQSRDFNLVLNGAEMHKDGSFIIRDVAPGAYTILASVENAPTPMMARQSLQVINSVDGLRLVPQSGGLVRGRVHFESRNGAEVDPSQFFLTLHPVDGDEDSLGMLISGSGFNTLTRVASDGSFEWKNVPPGNYFVQLAGDSGSDVAWFLKSIVTDGRDITDTSLNVSGGALSLSLAASANGAVVDGIVTDAKGQPVTSAVVVAVPEARLRPHLDRFRKSLTDQGGRFHLRSLAPGEYTLYAWESVDGDQYYNPDFLKACEGQGSTLHVAEGEHASLPLAVIPSAEDQP
ncbi:MAG TPA: carboxypeptidase-like regulatory domain-containing protein [Verrucomicrobiae bacterium]|nr:carboxypeptidase-like regulatory domain-containing protein [Verrucomicrobiae bacterium]